MVGARRWEDMELEGTLNAWECKVSSLLWVSGRAGTVRGGVCVSACVGVLYVVDVVFGDGV